MTTSTVMAQSTSHSITSQSTKLNELEPSLLRLAFHQGHVTGISNSELLINGTAYCFASENDEMGRLTMLPKSTKFSLVNWFKASLGLGQDEAVARNSRAILSHYHVRVTSGKGKPLSTNIDDIYSSGDKEQFNQLFDQIDKADMDPNLSRQLLQKFGYCPYTEKPFTKEDVVLVNTVNHGSILFTRTGVKQLLVDFYAGQAYGKRRSDDLLGGKAPLSISSVKVESLSKTLQDGKVDIDDVGSITLSFEADDFVVISDPEK